MKLAARNTGDDPREIALSKLAVATQFNADQFKAYLDDKAHYGKQKRTVKGVKGVEVEVRRVVTVNAQVPETLYVALAQAAYNADGGGAASAASDVQNGYMARYTRLPLFTHYNGWSVEQADAYETERAATISAARSERMSDIAAARGVTLQQVQAELGLLEKLRGSKSFLSGLQKSDPDLYEMLMSNTDTES